jgi:hypothetical protein
VVVAVVPEVVVVDVPVVPVNVPDVSVDVAIVPDVSVMVPDPIDAVSVDIAEVSVPAVSTLTFSSREHAKPKSVNAATIKSAVSFFIRVLSSGE